MPVLKCNNCGSTTNTAVSDYNLRGMEEGATRCYAAFKEGKWTEGCAYTAIPMLFIKQMVNKLIKGGPK